MDEHDEYLLRALIKSHGETNGRNLFEYHLETTRHHKKGDNVIHLSFEGDAFSDGEVIKMNEEFLVHNYQFSYVDESRIMKAHFDYQEIIAHIAINFALFDTLKNSIIYPAIWDSLKALVAKVVKRKNDLKEKVNKDTVCLTVEVKKNKSIKLLLKGNVESKDISLVMDKALEFAKGVDVDEKKRDGYGLFHYYSIDENGNVKFLE